MSLISLRHVTKVYDLGAVQVRALRGVSLDVEPGEFVAITGPSGSGKSTLMHILGCLDRPTSGEYVLDGQPTSRQSRDELAAIRNEKIGFVFQGFNLLARTTALENVELPLLYRRRALPAAERRRRARAALEAVGLTDRAHHLPNQLSGGQQQRVAIARAMAQEPRLMLADEPAANLDPVLSEEVMRILRRFNEQLGMTVVINIHALDLALKYAKRIIAFRRGELVFDGTAAELSDAMVDEIYERKEMAA